MPRLTAVHWRILECIFFKAGFSFEREKGDHKVYTKPGVYRPVVIPTYKEVDKEIIQSNMRTASMSRNEYFSLLEQCKGAA